MNFRQNCVITTFPFTLILLLLLMSAWMTSSNPFGTVSVVLGNELVSSTASELAFSCTVVTEIPQAECQALVDFYAGTNGANWINATGWLTTTTPCQWYGIGCSNGHVIDINMPSNQLQGDLPLSISNLQSLYWLILPHNRLTGPIPTTVSTMKSMESIDLYDNQLTGQIPTSLGNLTNLLMLSLAENNLQGPIPRELGSLAKLQDLHLGHNRLSGQLPAQMGQLTTLHRLTLEDNQLTGALPTEFGNLAQLVELHLWQNQLSGPLPASFGNLSQLQVLVVSENQLNGAIPPELGQLSILRELNLSTNLLTGSVPTQLGDLLNLQFLYLSDNQLTGPLPDTLGNLVNLRHFTIYRNPLNSSLPSALGDLVALEELDVAGAGLTGSIPTTLADLRQLRKLVLWDNDLHGEIPGQFQKLTNLQILALAENRLTGSIPANLSALTQLTELYLDNNQLTGNIPPQLGTLTNVITLTLNNNELNGSIPPELGQLNQLQTLHLGTNKLNGELPPSLGGLTNLERLYAHQNQLNGTLPVQLGQLSNLQVLHLGDNQLSGVIPPELGQLTHLQLLILWNNGLHGALPPALASLTELQGFHLNGNQLDGTLPTWIGRFTKLEELNLSQNEFTGAIPGEIGNLVNLHRLYLNHNRLTGPLPVELGRLTALEYLIFWVNQLTGSIPSSIGELTDLRLLGLSENQFSGELPAELGKLQALRELHLHTNQLSGKLSSSMGELRLLEKLYLGNNAFAGEIPATFVNMTALNTVDLKYNMLTATDPTVAQFLVNKDATWQETQTTAPRNIVVTALNAQVIQLKWTPPLYQNDSGGYQISYGTQAGGPYPMQVAVSNKATTRFNIGGFVPGERYYFVLRTYTLPHGLQRNDLHSEASQEVTFQMPESTPSDTTDDYNDCASAKLVGMAGVVEEFRFERPSDEDWIRFDAQKNVTYRIDVQVPNSSPADVLMDLYEECTTDPTESWNETYTLGARLVIQAQQSAPLYIRLRNHDATVAGEQVKYFVAIQQFPEKKQPGALIIVEGRLRSRDPIQPNIYQTTDRVYRLFQEQGYSNEDIYYLATTENRPGFDANSTIDNLHFAITEWAKEKVEADQSLTLYLMDHGDINLLYLDEINQQRLTPTLLDKWLSELQSDVPGIKINVIIESCHSGSFLQGTQSISGPDRVVITSTSNNQLAWASEKGARFSDQLLTALEQGFNLGTSFQSASEATQYANIFQEPWIDADGNAIPNEKNDLFIAAQRGFDYPNTLETPSTTWPPYIAEVRSQDAEHNSEQLWVKVRDDQGVANVWANIYPPSYISPSNSEALVQESLQQIYFLPQGDDWYVADYPTWAEGGTYRLIIYAEDDQELQSSPISLNIQVGYQIFLPLVTH